MSDFIGGAHGAGHECAGCPAAQSLIRDFGGTCQYKQWLSVIPVPEYFHADIMALR